MRHLCVLVLMLFSGASYAVVTCSPGYSVTADDWGQAYDQQSGFGCAASGSDVTSTGEHVLWCYTFVSSSYKTLCYKSAAEWQDYDDDGIPDDRDPPPPDPEFCPANQHPQPIGGGDYTCMWDDTTCPGGEGWYPTGNVCKPSGQEQCTPSGGTYNPDGGGYCEPTEPSPESCPYDTRYDPVLDKCVHVGDMSGIPNPDYPPCSPTMDQPSGGCYDPSDPYGPISEVPPFCDELPVNSPPTTVCRNRDGTQGHPPQVDEETGKAIPPPQPGADGGTGGYGYCPFPLPECNNPSFACLRDGVLVTVRACSSNETPSDGGIDTPIGTGGIPVIGGGSGGSGGSGGGGGGGIGGGSNGGSSPSGGGMPLPSPAPNDPMPMPDPDNTPGDADAPPDASDSEAGTSGGVFGAGNGSGGAELGRLKGYVDAIDQLCDGGDCMKGPTCETSFCSASERLSRIGGYVLPDVVVNAPLACPGIEFDFSDTGIFSFFGTVAVTSHCTFLEQNRDIITLITNVLMIVGFIFIVLDA